MVSPDSRRTMVGLFTMNVVWVSTSSQALLKTVHPFPSSSRSRLPSRSRAGTARALAAAERAMKTNIGEIFVIAAPG